MVDLIPGTALPVHTGPGGEQTEGRGTVTENPERTSPSLLERIGSRDEVSPLELAVVEAALRAFDKRPPRTRTMFASAGGQTDATTGNLIMPLFEVPQGWKGDLSSLIVDTGGSATITPSAPYSNAASYAFIAVAPPTTFVNPTATVVAALRRGLVAFAPNAAAGPIIPGQWTFGGADGPIAWGGEMFYFVLVGGSIAAIQGQAIQATYRVELTEYPN